MSSGPKHPARGGRGPSTPNWPNRPLHGSTSAKVGGPPFRRSKRKRRLLRLAARRGRSPTFADSEPRRRPFVPWACRDCGPLGLDCGPKAHFDLIPK
eukprot:15478618-Alexandrium_andersonii.AAC.1